MFEVIVIRQLLLNHFRHAGHSGAGASGPQIPDGDYAVDVYGKRFHVRVSGGRIRLLPEAPPLSDDPTATLC